MNKTRKKKAGRAVDSGGYGCLFIPQLECRNRKKSTRKGVSKLGINYDLESEWKQFIRIKKYLKKIPNYKKYFLIDNINKCIPAPLTTKDKENMSSCGNLLRAGINEDNINQYLNKLIIINMPYGGINLHNIINSGTINYITINSLMQELLLNAILPMNKLKIYHFDIKSLNILYKDNHLRLIDYGEVGISQDNQIIPRQLYNKGIQYNTPFSRILFIDNIRRNINFYLKSRKSIELTPQFYLQLKKHIFITYKEYIELSGMGHELFLSKYFLKDLFNARGIYNVSQEHYQDLVTLMIVNYCTMVVYHYINKNTKEFDHIKYFENVYSKNVDIYGFIMCYMPYIKSLESKYIYHEKIQLSIINIIIKFCFNTEYSIKPIPINLLLKYLNNPGSINIINLDSLQI
tara:strand:+ start:552 stop:1763 length:1212 start_codon:yes stop_codon:yes gene_type:complete